VSLSICREEGRQLSAAINIISGDLQVTAPTEQVNSPTSHTTTHPTITRIHSPLEPKLSLGKPLTSNCAKYPTNLGPFLYRLLPLNSGIWFPREPFVNRGDIASTQKIWGTSKSSVLIEMRNCHNVFFPSKAKHSLEIACLRASPLTHYSYSLSIDKRPLGPKELTRF
jgi:hypothetical protein